MLSEAKLIEKLKLIEALHSGAATAGEREAAARARERILERLDQFEKADPPVEFRFSLGNAWSRKLFVALLRRYGIRPYRYHRQRHTTVMAKVSKGFVDDTLWPEFKEIDDTLESYLSEVTNRVISQVIHQDASDAEVLNDPAQLPAGRVPPPPPPAQEQEETTAASSQSDAPSSQPSSSEQSSKNKKKRKRKKRKRR